MNSTIVVDRFAGSPEQQKTLAMEGRLTKFELVELLPLEKRQGFLDACAVIEQRYTDECAAENDPCIGPECAVKGEVCLEPLVKHQADYQKAIGAEWASLANAKA